MNHINKYSGFDLLLVKRLSNDLFKEEKPENVDGKRIAYIFYHFRFNRSAFKRKHSISLNDIILTSGDYHVSYDNFLTEKQTVVLIDAWDTLRVLGMIQGGITEQNIENNFKSVIVDKDNKKGPVNEVYGWKLRSMKMKLIYF